MKSNTPRNAISFLLLQERLIEFVLQRVNNGDFTERGLARVIGISQPQIHNVLKGKRRLHTSLADRIMQKFEIDVLELIADHELRARLVNGPAQSSLRTVGELVAVRKAPGREKKSGMVRDDKAG